MARTHGATPQQAAKVVKRAIETLKEKAEKCGCQIENRTTTLDNNWGNLIGMVFSGKSAKRAADYFYRYMSKHQASGYKCQNALSVPKPHQDGWMVAYVYYPCAE